MKLCLNACCSGRVLCENVVTKGIMILGGSGPVPVVCGVAGEVGGKVGLKGGCDSGMGLKGGSAEVLKGGLRLGVGSGRDRKSVV